MKKIENLSMEYERLKKKTKAWYVLRKDIDIYNWEELLDELIHFGPKAGIDEVIISFNSADLSCGHPTIAQVKEISQILKTVAYEISKAGMVYSFGPYILIGHAQRGRDMRKVHPSFDFMEGHDGLKSTMMPCPLSPGWRNYISETWTMYALTKPTVLWVDDDFRMFGHAPLLWPCFCPLHLAAFSKEVGRKVSREELINALLQPGIPHPWRAIWMKMNGAIMVDVARLLEQVIHRVSPTTRMGLMYSAPFLLAAEGQNWKALVSALAGKLPLHMRPSLFAYSTFDLHSLYASNENIQSGRDAVLPARLIEQTEVENFPNGPTSKSCAITFLQMALSFASGCDATTVYVFDRITPMVQHPEMIAMLGEKKNFLESLAQKSKGDGIFHGIRVLRDSNAGQNRHLSLQENNDFLKSNNAANVWINLLTKFGLFDHSERTKPTWRFALERCGISTTYSKSSVVAISGQSIRGYSKNEILDFLKSGVLLDLDACKIIIELGLEEYIGIKTIKEFSLKDCLWPNIVGVEEFFDRKLGGKPGTYLGGLLIDILNRCGLIKQDKKRARISSQMLDINRKPIFPLLTLFTNKLGGRVAVLPYDISEITCGVSNFLRPMRIVQLRETLRWLSRGKLPMAVTGGAYPLTLRVDYPDRILFSIFNLSLDAYKPQVEAYVGKRKVKKIEILGDNGVWKILPSIKWNLENGILRFQSPDKRSYEHPLFVCIR
ncbi:MAG: hypothetical protein A2096_04700 [Spirochaetes bacterium GWF1_41_5]|nr:MAG: hypothetical protein A2096_04700 [Spirochaetes bacterium GWF1_41_5]